MWIITGRARIEFCTTLQHRCIIYYVLTVYGTLIIEPIRENDFHYNIILYIFLLPLRIRGKHLHSIANTRAGMNFYGGGGGVVQLQCYDDIVDIKFWFTVCDWTNRKIIDKIFKCTVSACCCVWNVAIFIFKPLNYTGWFIFNDYEHFSFRVTIILCICGLQQQNKLFNICKFTDRCMFIEYSWNAL